MTTYELQSKDDDLDAIADLTTEEFGLALLATENFAAFAAAIATGTPSASTYLRGDGTWATPPTGEGGGAVDSVNGEVGDVTLTASDVGADATGTAAAAVAAHAAAADPHPTYQTQAEGDARYFRPASGTSLTDADIPSAVARDSEVAAGYQPLDADLTSFAGLASAANKLPYATGAQTWALTDLSVFARTLLDDADAATARTTIGAQQSNANLTAVAGVTTAADKGIYWTGSGTAATYDLGSFARGLLALTTDSAVRTYLGLVIGTNVQAFNSNLASIAALTTTTFGRARLTDADAAAARTALELGTAATVNTGTTNGTVPVLGASGTLAVARLATGTPDGTKFVRDDGTLAVPSGGSGELVAGSVLWDAKGDLAVGTGSDAADNLTVGANDTMLMADSAANAMGLKWATPSVVRTALGLVVGTNVQAFHANLSAFAGLSLVADRLPYANGTGTLALATFTSFGRSLVDDTDAAAARTTLGLTIGTDVQAYDLDLANIAALSTTSYGRSILTVADASAARSYIGTVIGTDVQAQNSKLTALSGLTGSADVFPYFTGASSMSTAPVTSFARTLLDDNSSATARATLGIPVDGLGNWLGAAGTTVSTDFVSDRTNSAPYVFMGSASVGIINRTTASNIPLYVQGMASQTGHLLAFYNSSSTLLSHFTASGVLTPAAAQLTAQRTALGIDASTTPSSSTVGQGDVEADLDWLHANTAGVDAISVEVVSGFGGTTNRNNTSAEEDLISFTLPGNTLNAAGDELIIEAGGDILANSGSPTFTWKLKNGAVVVDTPAASMTTSANLRRWKLRAVIRYTTSNTQAIEATLHISQAISTTEWNLADASHTWVANITDITDTDFTASSTIAFTVQMSVANANNRVRKYGHTAFVVTG